MAKLLERYDRLVIFDTETTGLHFSSDEIIEFAAAVVENRNGAPAVTEKYDDLVTLSPLGRIPPEIQKLTGISPEEVAASGVSKEYLCAQLSRLFAGEKTLLLAYNAHFDLSFIYHTLRRWGDPTILRGKDKVDLLTVYRDRRSYPHRLASAIAEYQLQDQVRNSHRAIDDVLATVAVMQAMEAEREDLLYYVNLFGYNDRYGLGDRPIRSVTYLPQPFRPGLPLYTHVRKPDGMG